MGLEILLNRFLRFMVYKLSQSNSLQGEVFVLERFFFLLDKIFNKPSILRGSKLSKTTNRYLIIRQFYILKP